MGDETLKIKKDGSDRVEDKLHSLLFDLVDFPDRYNTMRASDFKYGADGQNIESFRVNYNKFKVGDRIRFKPFRQIQSQTLCDMRFLEHLCGREVTVKGYKKRLLELENWSDKTGGVGRCMYDKYFDLVDPT